MREFWARATAAATATATATATAKANSHVEESAADDSALLSKVADVFMLPILCVWAGIETTEQLLRAPDSMLAVCYKEWQQETRKDDGNQIGGNVLRNVVQQ